MPKRTKFDRSITKIAPLAILLAAVFGGSAQAGLIVNGGFETGDFSGWTLSGNMSFSGVECGSPHSGACDAYFGPIGSDAFLSQTLATTPGWSYDITLWAQSEGRSPNHFVVYWDGGMIYSSTDHGAYDWTLFSFPGLIASGAATDLTIGFRNDPAFERLDDVEVNGYVHEVIEVIPAPVGHHAPEPGSLSMMAVGGLFVSVSMALKYRRRRSAG